MLPMHREQLDKCCDEVVPRLNMVSLWPKLLEYKIFNRDDVNIPRWTVNLRHPETVRDIYLTIKTRGPHAFESFLSSLRESNHENLADLLEDGSSTRPNSHNNYEQTSGTRPKEANHYENRNNAKNELPLDTKNNGSKPHEHVTPREIPITLTTNSHESKNNIIYSIQDSDVPLEINVKRAVTFLDDVTDTTVQRYPMRSKPRGLVLIITNIHYHYSIEPPRISAVHDERNLRILFEQMGFRVVNYCDLKNEEILDRARQFSRLEDLRSVDSCFVIVSGHGNWNKEYECTEISGVDYNPAVTKTVLCSDIINCFTAEACRNLAGKPKVFIFQVCRGKKKQKAIDRPRCATDGWPINQSNYMHDGIGVHPEDNPKSIRNYADILVAHATMPGYVAFRDTLTGSWFIQILCQVFMNCACTTHLRDLFDMIDNCLNMYRTTSEECQTLTITSMGFNKHCYLHPALFEENT